MKCVGETFVWLSLVGSIVMCCPSVASARWLSTGDYVVVIEETSVLDRSREVATLSAGTNFRVSDVNGSYVAISKKVDGKSLSGWVRQDDVMKLDSNTAAVYATRDNLTSGQGQRLRIPKGMSLSIQIESDYAVDIFVVNEENVEAYSAVLKSGGKGTINALAHRLDVKQGALVWNPSGDGQYFLIIDNTSFPGSAGAKSGRTIHYSLAYCIDDPTPKAPDSGRGIVIGRATLDFDNYNGKNGREKGSFKVVVDVLDDDDDVVNTLQAVTDQDGYFFLENLSLSRTYQPKKLDGPNFGVPLPMTVKFSFGFLDPDEEDEEKKGTYRKKVSIGGASMSSPCAEPSILDVGHIALRVNEKGKIQARVDAAHASLANEGGSISIGFGENGGPLDRHDWFLEKFSGNGWCKVIEKDRDQVYKNREEAAIRKKLEEAKKTAEKKKEEKKAAEKEAEGKEQQEEQQ